MDITKPVETDTTPLVFSGEVPDSPLHYGLTAEQWEHVSQQEWVQ